MFWNEKRQTPGRFFELWSFDAGTRWFTSFSILSLELKRLESVIWGKSKISETTWPILIIFGVLERERANAHTFFELWSFDRWNPLVHLIFHFASIAEKSRILDGFIDNT